MEELTKADLTFNPDDYDIWRLRDSGGYYISNRNNANHYSIYTDKGEVKVVSYNYDNDKDPDDYMVKIEEMLKQWYTLKNIVE